jgi:subtilisin family serine protease
MTRTQIPNYFYLLLFINLFCFGNLSSQINYINTLWNVNEANLGIIDYLSSDITPDGQILNLANNLNTSSTQIFANCINSDGTVFWQDYFPNSNVVDEYGVKIKSDNIGNIFVCAARFNGSNYDFYISKKSNIGLLIWEYQFNSSGNVNDIPNSMELDQFGNVVVLGTSINDSTLNDFTIVKIDGQNGNLVWDNEIILNNEQKSSCIAINSVGDIFIAGSTFQDSINSNILTIKLSGVNGAIINSQIYNNPIGLNIPTDLKINAFGEVIIGAIVNNNTSNSDIMILAYSNSLNLIWDKIIDKYGLNDECHSLVYDMFGNPILAGFVSKTSNGTNLYSTKLNRLDGVTLWEYERTSIEDNSICKGHNLICDSSNIYVCGIEEINGISNFLTLCITQNGKDCWSKLYNIGNSESEAFNIFLKEKELYITGKSLVNGENKISTLKYSLQERPNTIEFENEMPKNIDNVLLIRFSKEYLNINAIDNKNKEYGQLQDFIKDTLITDITNKLGFDCSKLNTFKIHRRATSMDTLSITRLGDTIRLPNFWASLMIELPFGLNEQNTADSLLTLDYGIFHCTPNYIGHLLNAPNDQYYQNSQLGLFPNNTFPNSDINIENAWDIETGNSEVKVGVFDAIIDWSHPDFGDGTISNSKIIDGKDYTAGSYQNANFTSLQHGTSVAGIIGALRNNSIGVAGIAGGDLTMGETGCPILSFGIFTSLGIIETQQGITDYATIAEAVVEGSVETTTNYGYGLEIQNHSWGMDVPGTGDFQEAFEIAFKNHSIVVAARGNSGETNEPTWPACDNDKLVLTVIASGTDGNRKNGTQNGEGNWQSSYGRDGSNNTIKCNVDVMAPGTSELVGTTRPMNGAPYFFNNCMINNPLYNCFNGTSASAPHVSGLVALMCSHHNTINGFENNLTIEDVENIIEKTATDMNSNGYDLESGFGRLDAYDAILNVNAPYRVKHSIYNSSQCTITQNSTSNNVAIIGGVSFGIPNGTNYYEVKRYEVVWNINEILNASEQIIDWWELTASQRVGKNSMVNSTYPFVAVNLNVTGGNQILGNAKTYIYSLKKFASSTPVWYPIKPEELQYAYSLHIKDNSLGITDDSNDFMSIFPNPSSGIINVDLDDNIGDIKSIQVIDFNGRPIYEFVNSESYSIENIFQLDCSSIINGCYFINIFTDQLSLSQKILIKK